MKKNDFLLIGTLFLIGAFILAFQFSNKKSGEQVVITIDDKVYKVVNISEDVEIKVELEDGHYNTIQVKDGKVKMLEADCSNQVCVQSSQIEHVGETIVCLPHKVIVKIVASEQAVDKGEQ